MASWTFPTYPPEPLQSGSHSCRVAVVGAGAAGLMATRMLSSAGFDVTLLEGSRRPGGRIRTVTTPFSPGLHADVGAAFIPCNHTYTVGLARSCGLVFREMVPAIGVTRRGLVGAAYLNGTLVRDPHTATDWPVKLSEDEKGETVGELLRRYIGDPLQGLLSGPDPRSPGWPTPELAALDEFSFLEFLLERGASPGAIDILRLGLADLWGEGVASVSALFVLRDLAMATVPGGDTCREAGSPHHPGIHLPRGFHPDADSGPNVSQLSIVGGNARLPARMAAELGEHIRYGCVVRAIHTAEDGTLRVVFDGDGRETLRAHRVILAVPAAVLGRIQLFPGLSDAKRRAFAELGQTSVVRTFFEFSTRFWEASGLAGGCYTDLPYGSSDTVDGVPPGGGARAGGVAHATASPTSDRSTGSGHGLIPGLWINNQTYAQDTDRGILEVYAVGRLARWLSDQPEEERNAFLLEQVEKIFPGALEAHHGSGSWAWAYGPGGVTGYPFCMPGQLTAFGRELARPEGAVHFAGDHTSALPGWMQGAFESGVRAAREIQDAL